MQDKSLLAAHRPAIVHNDLAFVALAVDAKAFKDFAESSFENRFVDDQAERTLVAVFDQIND